MLSAFMLTSITYTVVCLRNCSIIPKEKHVWPYLSKQIAREWLQTSAEQVKHQAMGPNENGGKTTIPQSLPCGLRRLNVHLLTPTTSTATQLPFSMLLPPPAQSLSFKSALYSRQVVFSNITETFSWPSKNGKNRIVGRKGKVSSSTFIP